MFKRLTPVAWQRHIISWQQSGFSQKTYCQRHQLSLSTFHNKYRELNRCLDQTMKVVSCCPEQINGATTVSFFDQLKEAYPDAPKIHIILDPFGYHRCQLVKDAAYTSN